MAGEFRTDGQTNEQHLDIGPWRMVPLGTHGELSPDELDIIDDSGIMGIAYVLGDLEAMRQAPPLVRIHSQCLTGEVFGSQECECGPQLQEAERRIEQAGAGIIFYLFQEGRGAGLGPKLRAYALHQNEGLDTVEAYERQGLPPDLRDYQTVVDSLLAQGIGAIEILTNNPAKIASLEAAGIICTRRSLIVGINETNEKYMRVKAEKMGHMRDE